MARPSPSRPSASGPSPSDRPSFAGSERDCFAFLFGAGTTIVEQLYAKTFGARLAVLDVPRGSDIRRCLVSIADDGLVTQQSAMSLARPEKLVFDYEKVMALAVASLRAPRTVLLLGLGGGAMARFLAAYLPDCALTLVERDPTVIKLAKRYFHVAHAAVHADAASFVKAATTRFDAILVDLYGANGFNGPPLEFWDDCAARLAENGCLAINWADGRHKPLYRPHAARAAAHAAAAFYLAPRGFKDNVVQFCSADPQLDRKLLAERSAWLAKAERRKSILERCRVYTDLP
jgi:spermidine synthase